MTPNTFVIGAMKSATTSLCELLDQQDDVFVARPKEPDFFSRDEVYAKGLDWYRSLFKSAGQCPVIAEGSTSYTKNLQYPKSAERLAKHCPAAKLIYIVRNPIQRMNSHWKHEVLKNRTRLDVNEFIKTCPEVVDISCYWKQLSVFRNLFDDQQILVLFIEDLQEQPEKTIQRCRSFLGLPDRPIQLSSGNSNESSKRKPDKFPISLLRRYRWFDVKFEQLKQQVPAGWHEPLKRIFKSNKTVGSSDLQPETIDWAIQQLGSDPENFLSHCGKPIDYWNLKTDAIKSPNKPTH